MTTATAEAHFSPYASAGYDELFNADRQLSAAFERAVIETENLDMLKMSMRVLATDNGRLTPDELLAPYQLIAANLGDQKRVDQLVELYDWVYEHQTDKKFLFQMGQIQQRLAKQSLREFERLVPTDQRPEPGRSATPKPNGETTIGNTPTRQKLSAWTDTKPSSARLDKLAVNGMIDEASDFLRGTDAGGSHRPKSSAYEHLLEPVRQLLPKLKEADLKAWLASAKTSFLTSSLTADRASDYSFYPAPGTEATQDKVLDAYNQIEAAITQLVRRAAQQEPKKLVASMAAAATLAAALPAMNGHHKNSAQAISLASAESKAARTVLALTGDSQPVRLSPAASAVIQQVAHGQTVAPEILTTTAVIAGSAKSNNDQHQQTQVTIEGVATVPANHATQTAHRQNALVVKTAPEVVPQLYHQYVGMGAQTFLTNPEQLPANDPEMVAGHAVSAQAARTILGKAAAGEVIVSIDPTQQAAAAASQTTGTTAAAPTTTSTTVAPAPKAEAAPAAPEHKFDPSHPIDALYLALKNYKFGPNNSQSLDNQTIFAIIGNALAEGRAHPGTLENNPAGVYVTIESLPESTLYNTSVGYGLWQWTPAIKLVNTAAMLGVNPNTVEGQVAVLMHDLQQPDIKHPGNTYLQSMQAAGNLANATFIMEAHWERPTTTDDSPTRVRYAEHARDFITQNIPLPFTVIPLTPTEAGQAAIPADPAPTTTTTTVAPTTTTVAPTTSTTQPATAQATTATPTNTTSDSTNDAGASQWLTNWSDSVSSQSTTPGTTGTPADSGTAAQSTSN